MGIVVWPLIAAPSLFTTGGPHMLGFKVVFIGCPTTDGLACHPEAAMLWPYGAQVIWPPGGTEVGLCALFLCDVEYLGCL